ncbi:hypothetical protein ACFL1C_02850 [Pseudomonadota bacterium]
MAPARMRNFVQTIIYILALAGVLLLAACGPSKSTVNGESASETPPAAVTEAEIVDDFDGDGMEIPLDGSSLSAFNASLAKVKRNTSETNYTTLENAIEFLLVYDLGAQRDRAKLATRLNGLTGYEVVSKVGGRKPAAGKEKAQKAAADAKTIDG